MNGSVQKPGSLSRPTRVGLYLVSLGIWISGAVWLYSHYFLVKRGEFGPEVNPLEPWWLRVHGAFSFAFIWMFGLMWSVHVTRLWPQSRRRWSGGLVAGVAACLILTGYLLYYVGDDRARSVVSILHWGIGLAAPVLFLWHRVNPRKGGTKPLTIEVRNPGMQQHRGRGPEHRIMQRLEAPGGK